MSGPETNFYTAVNKHLPPVDELYRMKNSNDYVGGVPDFWYSAVRDLWVEYKFIVVPKRPTTGIAPPLSELQRDWAGARLAEGRDVAVIVGCKDGGVIFTDLAWNVSLTAKAFTERLLTRKQIADWIVQRIT